jgi:DNA-cytosine methyltransferase
MGGSAKQKHIYTVAELFCGCGGFSHGFARSGRFDIVLGNDIKKAALKTFQHNHTGRRGTPAIIEQDIRTVTLADIKKALFLKGVKSGDLDCLIGGPPCQGFSQMRRSEERKDDEIVSFKGYNRLDQDPRNDLVLRFLEIANALRPKFIVIENVPQMKSHAHNGKRGGLLGSVTELLHEMDYDARVEVVNAADYGVPQLRERLVILASRLSSVSLPAPTHANPETAGLFPKGLPAWVTVAEAIADLPTPAAGPEDTLGGARLALYRQDSVSEYAKLMRNSAAFPYNHLTRRYSGDIIETIKEMAQGETWDAASLRKQTEYEPLIKGLVDGGATRAAALQKLVASGAVNKKFYNKYYWSAYTRLAWERPALTITANANFLGSGRFTHPEEHRGITMREAARLQSFDDNFKFITSATDDEETSNIGTGLDMIGEAVPPLLAEKIAVRIAEQLDRQQPVTRYSPQVAKAVAMPFELTAV